MARGTLRKKTTENFLGTVVLQRPLKKKKQNLAKLQGLDVSAIVCYSPSLALKPISAHDVRDLVYTRNF